MGILPAPAEGQTFEQAYVEAAQHSEFVPVWGRPSPFYLLPDDLSGDWGRTFLDNYIRGNGMFPIIELSFLGFNLSLASPPDLGQATLSDPKWRESYLKAVLDTVRSSRPLYLCVGNEVNRWYELHGAQQGDPNGFQYFVSLYCEIYDAVKQASPQTKVFCTFARELVSQNREADLGVLSLFDPAKVDLLAFTSYPYALREIHRPDEIPDDYYSKTLAYLPGKPLALIETGWSSAEFFGGEEGQADFLRQVSGRLTRAQGIELELLGYSWLHDLGEADTVGLIYKNGTPKLGYQAWNQLSLETR